MALVCERAGECPDAGVDLTLAGVSELVSLYHSAAALPQ
jgi:hypothetical protein